MQLFSLFSVNEYFHFEASAAALLLVKKQLKLKECRSNGNGKYSSESVTHTFTSFHKSYKNKLYIKVIPTQTDTLQTQTLKCGKHSTDTRIPMLAGAMTILR